jgi:hypothetical protein
MNCRGRSTTSLAAAQQEAIKTVLSALKSTDLSNLNRMSEAMKKQRAAASGVGPLTGGLVNKKGA